MVRNNQKITIRIIKRRLFHGWIGTVNIYRYSLLEGRLSCSQNWNHSFDKVNFSFFHFWNSFPSQLIWMNGQVFFLKITFNNFERISWFFELSLSDRWPHFVKPTFLIFSSFHGKSCSTQLFSEYSHFEFNGAILILIFRDIYVGAQLLLWLQKRNCFRNLFDRWGFDNFPFRIFYNKFI